MWNSDTLFAFSPQPCPEGGYEVRWRIPADLPYFQGHFPNDPILPAVAVIEASVTAIQRATGNRKPFSEIPTAKFTGVLKPGMEVVIHLLPPASAGESWQVEWNLCEGATKTLMAELTIGF